MVSTEAPAKTCCCYHYRPLRQQISLFGSEFFTTHISPQTVLGIRSNIPTKEMQAMPSSTTPGPSAVSRKKQRNATNYVWTTAENRELMTWTSEHLPQVWAKASVVHAHKIKTAVYADNPQITAENIRHKVNNLKAKYRKTKSRWLGDGEGEPGFVSEEMRVSIENEFSDFFVIQEMIRRCRSSNSEISPPQSPQVLQELTPLPQQVSPYMAHEESILDSAGSPGPATRDGGIRVGLSTAERMELEQQRVERERLGLKVERLELDLARLKSQLHWRKVNEQKRVAEQERQVTASQQALAELRGVEYQVQVTAAQLQTFQEKRQGARAAAGKCVSGGGI